MGQKRRLNPRNSHLEWFAELMFRLREENGWTQAKVAERLRIDQRTYSQYETARRPPSRSLPAELDDIYGTVDLFQTIAYYAQQGHSASWFAQFLDRERHAEQVKVYEAQSIPGLLQRKDYARALLAEGQPPDLEDQVAARLARQGIITRSEEPARLFALVEEASLSVDGWTGEAMREQLQHIIDLSRRPNVFVQVVPSSARPHLGIGGSVQILRLPDGDLAYVDAHHGGRLVADPAEVKELEYRLDRIGTKALNVDSSREVIERVMERIA